MTRSDRGKSVTRKLSRFCPAANPAGPVGTVTARHVPQEALVAEIETALQADIFGTNGVVYDRSSHFVQERNCPLELIARVAAKNLRDLVAALPIDLAQKYAAFS